MQYYIKESEWEHILSFLRTCKGLHTANGWRLRTFIEAVWYMGRAGCQWRLLPPYYGCWRAVHQRFKSWCDKGIWEALFQYVQRDPDRECMMIDTTIIRAHACAAGYGKDSQAQEALGRSKGGFTTKIHARVDALGNPLQFLLTPGQRHDITQAPALTEGVEDTVVIADKGYDSNALVAALDRHGCTPVIPPKRHRRHPRAYDEHLYKERHLIECFFGKIKHFRRIFSRFDKSAAVYLAFLHFVAVFIWLR